MPRRPMLFRNGNVGKKRFNPDVFGRFALATFAQPPLNFLFVCLSQV
jgi:hypothetical protein